MTTSGTATFSYTRDQIIIAAGRKVGAFAAGETPNNQTITDFADALNMMVKYWNSTGIHLWTVSEATLFLQASQASYTLGPSSTDNATQTYHSTTLSSAAALSATTISLTSTTNIVNSDAIGITLDDGTLQWTTVTSHTSTTALIGAALTDTAASGNRIFNYTTAIVKPLRIPAARRYNISSAIDTPMLPLSRMDYFNLPSKTATGVPTQFYYDPQLTTGTFYVWPIPTIAATDAVKFTWYRPIQDFNASGDTPDLPQEWINCLIWNLAFEMAPEYGVNTDIYGMIKERANETLTQMMGWDKEPQSVSFGVAFDQMGPGR